MRKMRKGAREIAGLLLLFVVFLVSAAYYEQKGQEITTPQTPSSFNAAHQGVKALFLLLQSQGFRTDRLETTWNALRPDYGLLVVVEPFTRPLAQGEIDSLRRWVVRGGSVLYLVGAPPRPRDPKDTVFGDIAVIAGTPSPIELAPAKPNSPLTAGISRMRFQTPVRVLPEPNSPYETLFQDASGPLVLHRTLGKGNLIVVADAGLADNARIKEADNAVFLVDTANVTLGTSPQIALFDEYHHGIGYASEGNAQSGGWIKYLPAPFQMALWQLAALGVLLIYNGNRRFGPPRANALPDTRSSADYLLSMAHLFRRAHATDAAVMILTAHFRRDLARTLNVPPDSGDERLAQAAARQCGADAAALQLLLDRCRRIAGGEKTADVELPTLARQIEQFRRQCNLVRSLP